MNDTRKAKYTFNFWFEWGCSEDFCPCLWPADKATRAAFDGCADIFGLPISDDLTRYLCELGMEHDEALDWEYPPNPLLWTDDEQKEFIRKAKEAHRRLQEELGEEYQINYCCEDE